MTTKLPNLTAVVVAVAVLAVLGRSGGTRLWPPSRATATAPTNAPARRPGAASSAAQVILRRAILALESHRTVSAKIRQSGDLLGQNPIGSGVYLQKRADDNLLFRLELRLQFGDQTGSLVQVCDEDGQLWIYRKLPHQEASLRRVDIQRVKEALGEVENTGSLHSLMEGGGFGGIPRLLKGLDRWFDFMAGEETWLARQLPVWKLTGQWNRQSLIQLLPDQQEAIRAGRAVDLSELPEHVPDHVVLFLGKNDFLPYRLEYHRAPSAGKAAREPAEHPILTMELFEVQLNVPIDPPRFRFPMGLDYSDGTDAFLDALDVER